MQDDFANRPLRQDGLQSRPAFGITSSRLSLRSPRHRRKTPTYRPTGRSPSRYDLAFAHMNVQSRGESRLAGGVGSHGEGAEKSFLRLVPAGLLKNCTVKVVLGVLVSVP